MQREQDPAEELARILAAMGDTAGAVAECLRAHGCRGCRGGGALSPVFRYVYRHFDGGHLALVHSFPPLKPSRLDLTAALDGRRSEIPLPDAVADFLVRFDEGLFPDLDLESSPDVA